MKKFTLLFAAMLVCVLPAVAQSVSEPDVDLSVETASSDSDYVLVADSLLLATIAEQADSLAQVADSASNAALPVVETADAAVGEVADAVSEVAEDTAVPADESALAAADSTALAADSLSDAPSADDVIAMDYVPNPFKDNWELSLGGGAILLWNGIGARETTNKPFYDATGGVAEISASKWFNPYLGMRLGWLTGYLPFKQLRESSSLQSKYPIGAWHNYVHADILWDWTAQFGGYNPTRVYDFIPYVHMGMLGNAVNTVMVAGGVGFLNRFHVHDNWLINLDARTTATSSHKFGVRLGVAMDVEILVGVTYRFDNVGWKKTVDNPYKKTLDELRAANEELDQKRAEVEEENEKLDNSLTQREQERKELAQLVAAITKDTTFYGVPDTMEMTVYYGINSSDLSAHEKAHMNTYLRLITLNDPNYMHIYKVVGSADAGTGAREVNENLCRRRAETIKNVLIESGVDPDNITTEIEVIETGDAQLARASHVVIYPVEKPKVVIPDSINLDVDDEEEPAK